MLLVTVMVYVFFVVPSAAVTTTEIVLEPMERLAAPAPLTVALPSFAVAETVTLEIEFATLMVYAVVAGAKAGLRLPELTVSFDRVASVEIAPAGCVVVVAGVVVAASEPLGLPQEPRRPKAAVKNSAVLIRPLVRLVARMTDPLIIVPSLVFRKSKDFQ
jgi:hypothetical protein